MALEPISPIALTSSSKDSKPNAVEDFQNFLKTAIQEVNAKEARAGQLVGKVATGEVSDLHQVMIALQEADVALQLTLQIRNKIVEAYQEISRMQV